MAAKILFIFLSIFSFLNQASAEIIWNGFASVYGRSSLGKNVRDESTDDRGLNFGNDSKIGLNIRSDFAPGWSAVGQFLASQKELAAYDESPNWGGEFDWFFLKYEDQSGLSFKVGRQLLPGSVIAEYVDVGLTYPWRELPQQYNLAVSFKSMEGVSAAYQIPLGEKTLSMHIYGGNSKPNLQPSATTVVEVNDIIGGGFRLDSGDWLVQAMYTQFHILVVNPSYSSTPPTPTTIENAFLGTSQAIYLGGRYDDGTGHVVYLEYLEACRTHISTCDVRSYYGTYGYHIGKFLPHYTYAFGDWIVPPYFDGHEISHTFGLNYQLRDSIVIKAEYLRQEDKHGKVFLTKVGEAESVAIGLDVVF